MIPSHNTDGNRRTGRAHQSGELRPWLGNGSGAGAQPASLFTVTSRMLAQRVLTDGVRPAAVNPGHPEAAAACLPYPLSYRLGKFA